MILIVGCKGSIGSRYVAICNYYGYRWIGIDVDEDWPHSKNITHVLICTPTKLHVEHVISAASKYPHASIMVEKPLSLNIKHANKLLCLKGRNIFVVNNWAHVFADRILKPQQHKIAYNYYQTGPHGKYIDCCQLVYLSKCKSKCTIKNTSPIFDSAIDGRLVCLEDVYMSYVNMIHAWVYEKYDLLWTISDGIRQLEIIEERYGSQRC